MFQLICYILNIAVTSVHYEAFRKIIINSSVTISLNETRVPSYNYMYYSILIQKIFHYLRALTNSFNKILLFY